MDATLRLDVPFLPPALNNHISIFKNLDCWASAQMNSACLERGGEVELHLHRMRPSEQSANKVDFCDGIRR